VPELSTLNLPPHAGVSPLLPTAPVIDERAVVDSPPDLARLILREDFEPMPAVAKTSGKLSAWSDERKLA